ncbi:MAG TPA: hypothetical protein VKJ47_04585 [Candidatus Binatia bacterium]|nr:hypothetical protein [Candidatus Binatia bacterium]
MSPDKTLATLLCAGLLVAALGGCKREGPMERAGKQADKAVEDLQEATRKEGPAERAGKKIDKAAEEINEAVNEAVKDATKRP